MTWGMALMPETLTYQEQLRKRADHATELEHRVAHYGTTETLLLTRIVMRLEARLAALEQVNPDLKLPEECRSRKCSYYEHYLAYGGPDLLHEGYHAEERNYVAHASACRAAEFGHECRICLSNEKRLRA